MKLGMYSLRSLDLGASAGWRAVFFDPPGRDIFAAVNGMDRGVFALDVLKKEVTVTCKAVDRRSSIRQVWRRQDTSAGNAH